MLNQVIHKHTKLSTEGLIIVLNQVTKLEMWKTGYICTSQFIVLARIGAKRVNQAIGGSGREQVTLNCGGSTAGKVFPPCKG